MSNETDEAEPAAPDDSSTAEPVAVESRAVHAWRDEFFPRLSKRNNPEAWKHAAAAVLHGWPLHQHHTAAPMELSRGDYEAALEAACTTDELGNYTPHPGALSPHAAPKPAAKASPKGT